MVPGKTPRRDGRFGRVLYFSGLACRIRRMALLLVPYREVRHDRPDDCLHYESVAVRGSEMHWTIPAHRHEGLHQFQMLEAGRLQGSIDGREFEAEAPAMLMLAPGSVHGFSYTPDAVGHQLTIPTAALRQQLHGSGLVEQDLSASFILAGDAFAQRVAPLFQQIAREFAATAPGRVHALLSLAALVAIESIRGRGEQIAREQVKGVRDALVQRFLALAEKHYAEHRPLDFYAAQLDVTTDHLSRCCRRIAGRSALQLLHDRLMLEARRLLAYTPMPVAQVAEQLGYADPAYFTKVFGREMRHSPIAYRTQVAQGVQSAGALPG